MRFRGAKHSPKKLEKDILERSKALWENPELLRPVCQGDCRRCHFDKPFKQIQSLERIKDDADKLVKAASRGDNMVRAYAATTSLYVSGKIPYLATARFPGEEVSFAVRGKVGQDKLIATQYYDDPEKRPLLYMEMAKKKRLHLYSLEKGMVCSDRARMPLEYLHEILQESPYAIDESLSCGHDDADALVIRVLSLGKEVRLCRDCAGKTNLLHLLLSRVVSSQAMDDFELRVEHKYVSSPSSPSDFQIPDEILEQYRRNQLNDRELIDGVLKVKRRQLRSCGSAVYVMEGRNYGCDLEAFMADLRGSEEEKAALQNLLEGGLVPVLIDSNRASEAIQELWADHAAEIVSGATSMQTLEEMGDLSRMNPTQALQEALFKERSRQILANLPVYSRLGDIGSLADRLARVAKTGDAATLRRDIEFKSLRDFKARAVALAFIKASSTDESSLWQFSKEETEFADYLVQFAKMMIEAEGDGYHDALEALLTASGSAEKALQ